MTTKLTDDGYKKPPQTFSEKLTDAERIELLSDYKEKNIKDIIKGTHVRYFIKDIKTKELKFRLGGIIASIDGLPEYVILSNGKKTWSVQVNNAIFYAKMSFNDFAKEFNDKIFKKDVEIELYKNDNKRLLRELNAIKKKYNI